MFLQNFDSGDDKVDVIVHETFYTQLFTDLNLAVPTKEQTQVMDAFLASIGALAIEKINCTQVIRFDVLNAAWQVQGYLFSGMTKFKKVKGLNFNMLSAKSIRILNRFAKMIETYSRFYAARKAQKPLPEGTKMLKAVIFALISDSIEDQGESLMIDEQVFYQQLVRLKVRKGAYEIPNLSKFLG